MQDASYSLTNPSLLSPSPSLGLSLLPLPHLGSYNLDPELLPSPQLISYLYHHSSPLLPIRFIPLCAAMVFFPKYMSLPGLIPIAFRITFRFLGLGHMAHD